MKKVTGACDICKRVFKAINAFGLKKCIASHKSIVHGIPGKFSLPRGGRGGKVNADLARYYINKGTEPKTGKGKQAMAAWRAAQSGGQLNPSAPVPQGAQVPQQAQKALLNECPHCKAKFWFTVP